MYEVVETNVTWNPSVKSLLYTKLRQMVANETTMTKLLATSCDDPTHGTYQPGGVCQVTIGNVAGRVGQSGVDPHGLGRWTYTTLQGKGGKKVVVVILYRLSQTTQPKGYKTAYNQQYRTLRQQGHNKPNPHK